MGDSFLRALSRGDRLWIKLRGPAQVEHVAKFAFEHHLDLEFYDKFYKPGAYLKTHAEHMEKWHP